MIRALLMLFLMASCVQAQVPTDGRTSMIEGRFTVEAPAGMRMEAMNRGLMAAEAAATMESRLVLEEEGAKLVIFAEEALLRAENGLEEALPEWLAAFETAPEVEKLPMEGGWEAQLVRHMQPDTTQNAIQVATLVLRDAEGLVMTAGAFVNPEAWARKARYLPMADALLRSVRPGQRQLDLAGRTVSHQLLGSDYIVHLPVPEGWAFSLDQGPDFEILKLRQVTSIHSSAPGTTILVYGGFHPSWLYKQMQLRVADAVNVPATFLGKKTEFLYFELADQGLFLAESMDYPISRGEGTILHVAAIGASRDEVKAALKVLAELSFAK